MKKGIILFALLAITISIQAQNVSKLYGRVNPSVVTITVEEKAVVTDKSTMTKSMVMTAGLGSGVVISAAGEIMTAAHVIAAAENVTVTFLNGEEVPAKVVTSNVDADVALIKLIWIPKNLVVAPIANSDEVKIGNQVIVIGAPMGLSHSLSVGHISGRMEQQLLPIIRIPFGQLPDTSCIGRFFFKSQQIGYQCRIGGFDGLDHGSRHVCQ